MKMILIAGMIFVWGTQPLFIMLSLLMVTLGYSMLMYEVGGSFWFGYMILLIMLSGVLVLFSYMLSFSPNMKFELSGFMLVIMFLCLLNYYKNFFWFGVNFSMSCLKIWEGWFGGFSIYLALFLFMIMVVVVLVSSGGGKTLYT